MKYNNIICSQMDNVLYTFYVYKATQKIYRIMLLIFICMIIIFISYTHNIVISFLILFAAFEVFQFIVESLFTAKELIKSNHGLKEIVMKQNLEKNDEYNIRCLQDTVINNRNNSLFIPKIIRNFYLSEDSKYYNELNDVKARFLEIKTTRFPEKASDIKIFNLNESSKVSMIDVHNHLRNMMSEVTKAFDESGVKYTLDGGTLIGAVRKTSISDFKMKKKRSWMGIQKTKIKSLLNKIMSWFTREKNIEERKHEDYEHGKFLFWDDDVDLAIPICQLKLAKEIIEKRFPGKYIVQDYATEEFYSPRLSNFRIRESCLSSVVSEKDSELYEKYKSRGLFLDIYAYSPILYNKPMDRIYRHVFIHCINKRIRKTESDWKYGKNLNRVLLKFKKQKRKYMNRVDWYLKHAKNKNYVSYVPNYIDNIKKAGPYIKTEDIFGEPRDIIMEGIKCHAPNNPSAVLRASYGEKWYVSPYVPPKVLKEMYGDSWFSNHEFTVTVLKHLDHINIF